MSNLQIALRRDENVRPSGMTMKLIFITTALLASSFSVIGSFGKDQDPKLFITDAIKGNLSEIALAKMAARNAAAEAVRTYGKTLAADHIQANNEASAVAAKLDLNPPAEPSAEAREQQTALRKLSGRAFDHAFLNYMIKIHQTDIQNFEDQVKARNGETSKMAEGQLPMLKKHLEIAQSLKRAAAQ
jgi:putative membrane protein